MPTKGVVSEALSLLLHPRRRSPWIRWPPHNLHRLHLAFKVFKIFNLSSLTLTTRSHSSSVVSGPASIYNSSARQAGQGGNAQPQISAASIAAHRCDHSFYLSFIRILLAFEQSKNNVFYTY